MKKTLLAGLAVGVMMFGSMVGVARATLIAEAGGPYYLLPGNSVTLDGSHSVSLSEPWNDIYSYSWDLANDGTYNFSSSSQFTSVTWATLYSQGLRQIGDSILVSLRVEDRMGNRAHDIANINIVSVLPLPLSPPTPTPEPATMLLMGTGLAGLIGARRKKKQ